MIVMDVRSAELTKYAANAMLATKISFMNELANLAERMGADIEKVRLGIGSDPRIGYHFIYPGCGYGGSCFPKDVQALARSAARAFVRRRSCSNAVEASTSGRSACCSTRSSGTSAASSPARRLRVWGLAFKPNTDDMREAPSRDADRSAVGGGRQGARLRSGRARGGAAHLRRAHRPDARARARPRRCEGADALAIVTEWQEFRSPDFDTIKAELQAPGDLRRPQSVRSRLRASASGLTYYAIGRGDSLQSCES